MSAKKDKRVRGGNFSEEDKMFLVQFVADNSEILESKASDPRINIKKQQLWKALAEKFRARGQYREPAKLKMLYFRLKQHAKTTIAAYRRSQHQTGGGPSSAEDPTDLDWIIADISAVDFTADVSAYDSEGKTATEVVRAQMANAPKEYTGLIDPITGEIEITETYVINYILKI